jgi:hypothetical protein
MKPLVDRIAEARDLAIQHEGDIRLKEFLRAMIIEDHSATGGPFTVSVYCEFKSWTRFLTLDALKSLEQLSVDELAATVAGWIQGAFNNNMLSISNPPIIYRKYEAPSRRAQLLGRRSTVMYDGTTGEITDTADMQV